MSTILSQWRLIIHLLITGTIINKGKVLTLQKLRICKVLKKSIKVTLLTKAGHNYLTLGLHLGYSFQQSKTSGDTDLLMTQNVQGIWFIAQCDTVFKMLMTWGYIAVSCC